MKKVLILLLAIATTTAAQAAEKKTCGRKMPLADKLYCQYEQNRAPAYYQGCFDIYAQLEGIERAKVVCAGEYEDWKEYQKQLKNKGAK